MGGNALKNVVTRRYARDEYFKLKEQILNRIKEYIPQYDVPREFPYKESFGDLDVLIVCPPSINIRNLIIELFQPTEIVSNGGVYSFDFEQFQIDFILVPKEQFENSTVYFSYSDLGGIIGNVCSRVGLKYGIQGLWMNIHTKEFDPTTTATKLMLSTDVQKIFHFLGYNYATYMKGFENDNVFFQWLIEGRYFSSHYFHDSQLNHAHRHRTVKRPIYIKFCDYLKENNIDQNKAFPTTEESQELTLQVRQQALIYFNKQEEYDEGLKIRNDKRTLRDKFNGRYFIDIDGPGSMVPVHMQAFQKRIAETDEDFHRWVLDTDSETIKLEIEKYKQEVKKQ